MRRKPHVQIQCRPGTQDETIFREVLAANEYRLPERFKSTDAIIDVGAHIGIASVACLLRGAGGVWAYEPDADNFRLLQENLHGYLGAHVHHAAVWRSDVKQRLTFTGHPAAATACGTVLPGFLVAGQDQKIPVATIGLDEVVREAGRKTGRVRLLKIDCEGAEYAVLYTSKLLRRIDEIVGEVHEFDGTMTQAAAIDGYDRYDGESLASHLNDFGFDVELSCRQDAPNKTARKYNFYAKQKRA